MNFSHSGAEYGLYGSLVLERSKCTLVRRCGIIGGAHGSRIRDASEVEVRIVLRNRGGSIIEKTTDKAVVEAGGPTYVHSQLNLDLAQLRTARRIEIAVAGSTRRTERVASFALPSTPSS